MKYLKFIILLCLFAVGCTRQNVPIKTNDAIIQAHIFLEGGFPGKQVDVSYNNKIIYAGIPAYFSRASKAYSAHILLKIEEIDNGLLTIRVKGIIEKSFNVNWSEGISLAAVLKDNDIFIFHPNSHGYK